MERIGIYGGTFNPIHRGHIHLARELQAALQFDRLLFIPSRIPPHKEAKQLASGQDSLEMVRLALEEELPEAMVSDLELKSRGKSYTFYTLEKLQALLPDSAFTLIMGTDMLLTFDQWFRWQDILSMACLAVAARNAGEQQLMEKKARALSPEGRITVVPMTPLPMSSTDVRRIIRTGGDPSALLPEKVWAYIRDRGLYQ